MHLLNCFSAFVFNLKETSILEKFLHFAAAPFILQIKKSLLFTSVYLQNRINSQIEMHHLLPQYLCRAPEQCAQGAFHCTCAWLCDAGHYVGSDMI